jgi:hypothetical protein
MKNFILILSLIFASTVMTYANDSTNVVTQVLETASNAVDSAKLATTNLVNQADTSSNFKRIYGDLKDGVLAIGQSLKVGAEHVYAVLVRQQVVNSVVYLLLGIFALILGILSYKQWGLIQYDSRLDEVIEVRPLVFTVAFGLTSLVLSIMFFVNLDLVVMGFANPEYGAIQDVINFVKDATDK